MLQHELQRPITHGKSLHQQSLPNYKLVTNNLNKVKSTSTISNGARTTIFDSSNTEQQRMLQPTNTTVQSSKNDTMTSIASTPVTPPTQNVGGGITQPSTLGVNLRVTGQCSQGGRKYMEDYFSVAYQQSENAKDLEYAFIGIYDGHGGAEAATFAKENLMMQIINQKSFWSDSDHDVLRAIREGYIATHYAMWRDQENWPKTANGLLSTAGTTATIAFIRREKIYIGHVGDSGIALGYQNEGETFWRARQLTIDHKPESPEERARIQRSGGKVVVKSGVPRVVWNRPRNAGHKGPIRCNTPVDEVPFLAVARSLGDLWSYNSKRNVFVVSPDPDVQVIKINPKTFRCLIFGTDGLWNVVTPQEAVDTVYERECLNERLKAYSSAERSNSDWTNPSRGLVERALKTWAAKKMRADNTSVVTAILHPTAPCEATKPPYIEPNTHTLNGLPKDTCGLEYTEVCAEMAPAADNYGLSYEEIAEKHTMPEAFRDFDYYLDQEAINAALQSQHEENCVGKYCNEELSYWNNWSWEERLSDCAGDYNHQHTTSLTANSDVSICSKAIMSQTTTNKRNNEHSLLTGDGEDNALDSVHASSLSDDAQSGSGMLNYSNYNGDTSVNHTASSDVSNELGNAGFMTFAESYNSFLNEQMSHDSTNSSNSNSNCQIISGTSEILHEQQLYQQQCMSEEDGYSLTKLETRREQQRCTSGVQTFKIFQALETNNSTNYVPQHQQQNDDRRKRAEEQTSQQKKQQGQIKQVQSVSTPQQANNTTRLTVEEARELEAALTWESACAPLSTTINPYLDYAAEQQPPLELNSLLQQEREEEQQVAYERLEMQRKLALVDTTKMQAAEATELPKAIFAAEECTTAVEALDETVEMLEEEYIDEESESAQALQLADTSTATDEDTSVQINEISSSMCEQRECDSNSNVNSDVIYATTATQTPQVIEKIEKIEILQQRIPRKLERVASQQTQTQTLRHARRKSQGAISITASASTPTTAVLSRQAAAATMISSKSDKPKVAAYEFTTRLPKACPARTSLKRAQAQYPNIPNENVRANETASVHALSKRRRYNGYKDYLLSAVSSTCTNNNKVDTDQDQAKSSSNTNTNNNASGSNYRNRRCSTTTAAAGMPTVSCAAIALEKRQLRSNSGLIDYAKRTLRTRNSLTKELKAKASLTSTMRRVTTQFLHDTAVSLMSSNAALAQQRSNTNSCSALNRSGSSVNHNNSNNNICSNGGTNLNATRRSRAEKLLTTNADNLEAAFSHVINLRSRKVAHFAAAAAAAVTGNHTQSTRRSKGTLGNSPLLSAASTTVLRRDRHNLRSLSTRNASSAGLTTVNGQRDYAYNKAATRSSLHATGLCAYSLPTNSASSSSASTTKLLNAAVSVSAATRPRAHAVLISKQSVGVLGGGGGVGGASSGMVVRGANASTSTSYGKRTTASRNGSGASATIMLTRSSGRNGRRLNR
uniref:Protein phosphatase 1D n=1 Tax=Ceratitis capitata TaxID=7213 RepID=W8B6R7_CERCA